MSIGDYVLSGGEAAALVVIDAVSRLVPGVLGNEASPADESFGEGLLEYPQYTRPREFMGMEVPDALLSGNHEEITEVEEKGVPQKDYPEEARPDGTVSAGPGGRDPHAAGHGGDGVGMGAVSLAIIHYPVLDKRGDIVSTSITNLELHDAARSCMTFGVELCYIVTPLEKQRAIAEQLVDHWKDGYGRQYNPHRAKALEKICMKKGCRRRDVRISGEAPGAHRDLVEEKGRLHRIRRIKKMD